MDRHLWAVTVISLTAICWATAFFGAGAGGVVASLDGIQQRLGQIEPEARVTDSNWFSLIDNSEPADRPSGGI